MSAATDSATGRLPHSGCARARDLPLRVKVRVAAAPPVRLAPCLRPATLAQPPAAVTVLTLKWLVVAGLVLTSVIGSAALTTASTALWTALIACILGLWAGWLLWRVSLGDGTIPAHVLGLFLAVPAVIVLGHLFGGGLQRSPEGRMTIVSPTESALLVRLLALCLLTLLAQDVTARVRNPRWLVTATGLAIAVGAVLRLAGGGVGEGSTTVAMGGLVGLAMLIAPAMLPAPEFARLTPARARMWEQADWALRILLATGLGAVIVFLDRRSGRAAAIAAAGAGAALLLSGIIRPRHRLRLLLLGLSAMAAAGLAIHFKHYLAGSALASVTAWGVAQTPGGIDCAYRSGLEVIASTTGWVGLSATLTGMAAALCWSLYRSRAAAPGDQARSAVWAVAVTVSGCALLAAGGLAVPSAAVVFAVAWGMMPAMMAHHVRRLHGAVVIVAFSAALIVVGLERVCSLWITPATGGDGLAHLVGGFMLTALLLWQLCGRRWWLAGMCGILGGGLTALGEVAQQLFSTRSAEMSDAACDFLGAALAVGLYLLVRGIMHLEARHAQTRPDFRNYRPIPMQVPTRTSA